MTCKDCVHYDICIFHLKGDENKECCRFKNKADFVEVKHGYWKDRYGNKYANHLYECSVCGKEPLYEFYSNELQQTKTRQVLSNSCPHCGAKMDGGAE